MMKAMGTKENQADGSTCLLGQTHSLSSEPWKPYKAGHDDVCPPPHHTKLVDSSWETPRSSRAARLRHTAQQQGKILPQSERKNQYQRLTSDLYVCTFVIHVPFM